MCYRSVTKLLKFWKVVLLALDELAKEAGRGDVKCKLEGQAKSYFAVVVCQALFGPCEELAKALQAVNTTVTGALVGSRLMYC